MYTMGHDALRGGPSPASGRSHVEVGEAHMRCQSCGHDNRPGAHFCEQCGTKLSAVCPTCGAAVRMDARFCDMCGQRLDEEVLYTIMQGCFARMMDPVHRYEGTIAQFLGDGFLALFGAPIAHEDSARRAVAAALEMQQAIAEYAAEVQQHHGVAVRFRVGLNTGPVVVGKIGDDLSMDYTAIGDTANLAARMQQLAEPGSVTLSEHTYRAVRDYIECASLGPLTVKGKAAPVTAYQAVGVKGLRTRLEVATARGLTPYVGREHELRVLRSYLERVRKGQGQVVFISGEAGIGKSRLLLEFRQALAGEALIWLEGHTVSFGRNTPYLPMIDILKQDFSIQDGDDDATIIARMEQATGGWEPAARATVPYLKYLLNVDPGDETVTTMDPMERRAGAFDAFRALLLQESRREPLVVVVEDLHWMDEMSEEVLAAVVDAVTSAPVLLIATYRPGYTSALVERANANRLHLTELQPEQSAALVEAMLQVTNLPAELRQLIASKAEGNPFYIEEVTTALIERGVLHRSTESYTLTRPIEQISEEQTSLDGTLQELNVLELIFQTAYFPELAYMFKHALTHDVASYTLLLERRKALHRIVASAVEELYADRLPEHYETLAYHYLQGEAWPKALEYLEKAGDKATAAYANRDALQFYAQALEICTKLGAGALSTSVTLAQKRGFINFGIANFPGAIGDFTQMLDAARKLHQQHWERVALTFRGMAHLQDHDFTAAERSLRAALAIANDGFDDVRLAGSVWLSNTLLMLDVDRHAEADPLFQTIDELAPQAHDRNSQAWWGITHALRVQWKGGFDAALAVLQRWRSAAEESQQ